MLDLIRVFGAGGTSNADDVFIDIEHEVMLTHKSPSNNHLVTVLHVKCNAVPIRSLTVEVLARVPIKRVASLAAFRPQLEA